ncbi:hypothetical protein PMAC_001548 [Pneumocystis sp. 'macacae']|nr:hypothetical protein PMAC_001548 [Pneumocystis sp. 'macacae']
MFYLILLYSSSLAFNLFSTDLENTVDNRNGIKVLEHLQNAVSVPFSMSSAVLTIRLIKSFVHRTIKYLVLHDVDLEKTTVFELQQRIQKEISKRLTFQSYSTFPFDTLKIYAHAHGSKTSNRVINLDHEEWILLDPSMTLLAYGVRRLTHYKHDGL